MAVVSVSHRLHSHRPAVAHLRGGDVLESALLLQVPDDHEASAIANHHLVWVDRALLQGLYVFQVPAADVVLWHAGRDRAEGQKPRTNT